MTDTLTKDQRSALMSRIRATDTKPEMIVRSLLHRLGYRYRLHVRDLPGTPDLVLPARKKVVLVHGCFWHRHSCRKGRSLPATNTDWWAAKFRATRQRDKAAAQKLRRMGWGVLTIWECELSDLDRLTTRLVRFLG